MLTPDQLAEIRGRSWRLKCDDCGSLFNERHQGEACPFRLCSSCKGTLQFHDVTALLMHIEEMEKERVNLPAWLEKVGDLEYEKDQLEQKVEALNAQVEKAKEIADALQPGYAPKDGEYFCSYCQTKSLPVESNHSEGCLQAMCEQILEGGQKP